MNMKQKQSGFTLIELVMVIVILGILAATALPKFVNLKADAELAAVKGIAGAVSSSFAVNYAGFMAASTSRGAVQITGTNAGVAAAISSVMVGGLPDGYSVTPTGANCGSASGVAPGSTVSITVSNSSHATGSQSAAATLVCTG